MTWEIEALDGTKITKVISIEVTTCVGTTLPNPLQDTNILTLLQVESGSHSYTINAFSYSNSGCPDDLVY